MNSRVLGNQGLKVAPIGLGCMGMSEFYGPSETSSNIRVIQHAIDQGMNHIDTADMYGPFKNEELVGRAIAGRRDQIVLATKFGNVRDENQAFLGIRGDAEYVRKSCDASLVRLGVDTIDLYYQHRVDTKVPIEETIGAMAELVTAGKVRYLGLSEASAETIKRANAVHPISALQSEYSLWTRDIEDKILDTLNELGIGLVAYSPLGRGFLSGAIRSVDDLDPSDTRRRHPRFQGDNFEQNLRLAEKVREIAGQKGVTPAQIVLAWLLAQGDNIVTIPGTRSIERVDENAQAVNVTLSNDELHALDSAFPRGITAGDRYPDMSTVNK